MKTVITVITLIVALTSPTIALAYVGPGAGLSLLGALWALILAIGTAILFGVAWPVRKMLSRRRAMRPAASTHSQHAKTVGTTVSMAKESKRA
jgi:hypothetical protein